ncbi:MAG: flavodoxin family protein [Candidatus Methanomethylophilaceae archaeon]|nr:flavodoxin family protein [Candidatus Methanomethylophilaceae archaeon]
MKATLIVGSARKEGSTEIQCEALADALGEEGFDVSVIRPYDMDIRHCTGCNRCFTEGKCHIKDDMHVIYDAVRDTDLIVLGTPVYFSGPSSIIKQVIDRFQLYWHTEDDEPPKKYVALVSTGGSRNPRFENVTSICRAFAFSINAKWGGESLVENTDGEDISPAGKEAYRFGKALALKIKGQI